MREWSIYWWLTALVPRRAQVLILHWPEDIPSLPFLPYWSQGIRRVRTGLVLHHVGAGHDSIHATLGTQFHIALGR
jgi:hypothetical protein